LPPKRVEPAGLAPNKLDPSGFDPPNKEDDGAALLPKSEPVVLPNKPPPAGLLPLSAGFGAKRPPPDKAELAPNKLPEGLESPPKRLPVAAGLFSPPPKRLPNVLVLAVVLSPNN